MVWRWILAGVGCLVLLMLYGMYIEGTPRGAQKLKDRDAIAACRQGQNDELAELETRRLTRQVCDKMEADYRQKWGSSP